MNWKIRNLKALAEIICGNTPHEKLFRYRSSSFLTSFFEDCDFEFVHDGSTRAVWVLEKIKIVFGEPSLGAMSPSNGIVKIIQRLLDKDEATETDDVERTQALASLNVVLAREGWAAFYDAHSIAQLRHIATNTISNNANPHRPFTQAETTRREQLVAFLEKCSEDDLIEEMLLPLFRQLAFNRITAAGHKDKALEYGKDLWTKFTLPTLHVLYFGIQAKKGKLDSAGVSKNNVSEIHNQITMMLGHEIFDPELSRRVLVDHAFIVAGGEITKQARNWIGGKLDASKISQVMFMDREDILNLFIVTNLPLPNAALPQPKAHFAEIDDIPF